MKLTEWLFAETTPKGGRSFQQEHNVRPRPILPLKLKERVSGKYDRTKLEGCQFEVMQMMNCLEQNQHESKLCKKEAEKLYTCYENFLDSKKKTKEAQRKVLLVPGTRYLTFRQIAKLFKTHPLR
ncbi:hypothetical protein QAD02_014859 [Eretmocerus hayati]|uniref:Uncharacterized protein n=1 Tax=Eretmocerus hayati TaxID=131215 RepID=A0ACC2P6Y9_9HYME|nr:hypothetical protein QAD02_014859 [Eretmocerus hayati]